MTWCEIVSRNRHWHSFLLFGTMNIYCNCRFVNRDTTILAKVFCSLEYCVTRKTLILFSRHLRRYNIHRYCVRADTCVLKKRWIFGNEHTYEAENNQSYETSFFFFFFFFNLETDKKCTKLLKIFWFVQV